MARIMVVDDERDVVTLIKFMLEKDGHQVLEAHNGQEALDKLAGVPAPELIILDVMMPVMDGYTLCTRLGESNELRAVPLLILTAKGDMRDAFELAPNVASYIEKPFDPKTLRELVTGMLKKAA